MSRQRLLELWRSPTALSVRWHPRKGTIYGIAAIHTQPFTLRRQFSSNEKRKGSGLDDIHALPFSVSPEEALEKFNAWAKQEQGLSYVLSDSAVNINAAFCPVWSFDLNLRFLVTDPQGKKRLDWKPTLLQAYGRQSVVHLPGLSAYAGYNYRRSLVSAVHNTTLIFMGQETVPFGPWMLQPMQGLNRQKIEISPDPWNATRRRALTIVVEEWQALAEEDASNDNNIIQQSSVKVQSQVVRARRVYMPTYVIEYSILGVAYQAFVSGADQGAAVSGVSHQLWESPSPLQKAKYAQQSVGILQQVWQTLQASTRVLGSRNVGILLLGAIQLGLSILGRLLLRIPLIAAIAGTWVAFRKVLWPYWSQRYQQYDWERERERENRQEQAFNLHGDDFFDTSGTAERFFQRNREAILRSLAGEEEHEAGDYDWYDDWIEWARRVYESERRGFEQQQQQQQQQYYGQQQQQQQYQESRKRQQARRAKAKPEYQWDFDPNDPYSVLKVSPSASQKDISQAFRREMLKYHPDTQAHATEAEKARATERSKIISEAYQRLKKKK